MMNSARLGWLLCIPLLATGTATAQQPVVQPMQPTQDGRKDEKDQKNVERQRIVRPADLEASKERIIKTLRLTEAQQEGLDIIIKAYDKRFSKMTELYRASLDDLGDREDMTALMRDAHNRGDTEQVEYLREQVKEMRSIRRDKLTTAHEQMAAAQIELHDDLESILYNKQKEDFEKLWDEGFSRARSKVPTRNPRAVLAVIERLDDLKKEQKEQVFKLYGDFYRKHRSLSRAEAKNTLHARQTKIVEDLLEVLTEKQREKVVKQLRSRKYKES